MASQNLQAGRQRQEPALPAGQPRTRAPPQQPRWSLFPQVLPTGWQPSMGTGRQRPRRGNRGAEAEAGLFRRSEGGCPRAQGDTMSMTGGMRAITPLSDNDHRLWTSSS